MALYKDSAFSADAWKRLENGQEVPLDGYVILSVEQWHQHQVSQPNANVPLGLFITPDLLLKNLGIDFSQFSLIALHFPAYTDGRAYSMARQLRDDYRFKGELRATGDVLFDQLQLMMRSGFDSFEITNAATIKLLESGQHAPLRHFYQPGLGREIPSGTRPWISRARN